MDELLRHCLRELAFEGDFGCNTSRIQDFIHGFYAHNNALHVQNLDDAFFACLWSLLVQQSTVRVGLKPEGISSEVWIAPQPSQKRKGESTAPQELEAIPESKSIPLPALLKQYAERLRIAADPDTIFVAATGSHLRSPRMTPMVYTALQIVTRGRDAGISVVDLGKVTGYDQKACFYLAKQLVEMDLVLKVRRGGVASNFLIHKHFFERSSSWKAIRDEENEAESSRMKNEPDDSESEDDSAAVADSRALNFTPIDARHLSSFPIISARVIKLLKASENHMYSSKNMIVTLGFQKPTKTDRRYFNSRMNEMVSKGLVEKVLIPNPKRAHHGTATIKCYRLVENPPQPQETPATIEDAVEGRASEHLGPLFVNATIQKQVVDLLEKAGTNGMTLNEIETALHGFDKRTLEDLLMRCEKAPPPPHLVDLHIKGIIENKGRERRYKFYTYRSYRRLVEEEDLDEADTGADAFDMDKAGGFAEIQNDQFYEDDKSLDKFYATLPRYEELPKDASQKKFKNPILPDGTVKRGRPRKRQLSTRSPKPARKNPILPDGTVKKGRPRKNRSEEATDITAIAKRAPKRKRIEPEEEGDREEGPSTKKARFAEVATEDQLPIKKKRGRPPKKRPENIQIPSRHSSSRVYVEIVSPRRASTKSSSEPGPTEDQDEVGADVVNEPPLSPPGIFEAEPVTTITDPAPAESDPVDNADERPSSPSSPRRSIRSRKASWKLTGLDMLAPLSPLSSPSVQTPSKPHTPNSAGADSRTSMSRSPPKSPTMRRPSTPRSPTTPIFAQSRVNVSHLRRENELLRLLERANGIVGTQSKEIFEEHLKLLEELSKAGEPASAPAGTRVDKRTLTLTFETMERKGKVKLLKTNITLPTGTSKVACVVYLPDVEEAKVQDYLRNLSQSANLRLPDLSGFTKLADPIGYGLTAPLPKLDAVSLPIQTQDEAMGVDEPEQAAGLPKPEVSKEEERMRDAFLEERTVIQQSYGYILARGFRCRQLHLALLQALESTSPTTNVVSQGKRIIDTSYLLFDLPLQLYCSLVAPSEYNENLVSALSDPTKSQTPVRNLSSHIHKLLHLAKSRSRSRFLEMLETLYALGLVTPLHTATTDTPLITCDPNGRHPTRFEASPIDGWSQTVNTPTYWLLHQTAPIHCWAISAENPPLWMVAPVSTTDEAKAFWDNLTKACTDSDIQVNTSSDESKPVTIEFAKSLRRDATWRNDYRFTENQKRYLRQTMEAGGKSMMDSGDAQKQGALFEKLAWITCVPAPVVEQFINHHGQRTATDFERIVKRRQQVDESRAAFAEKAEEMRLQRESEWVSLFARIHPDKLAPHAAFRIDRVRGQYLKAGTVKDVEKWEKEIRAALHEAELVATKGLKITTSRSVLRPTDETASVLRPSVSTEPSIYELIERQGPPIDHEALNRKRKNNKDNQEEQQPGPKKRRARFQWNSEFDELARDASVIIRSRCRQHSRLDWGAVEQVFPAVPRNTVRQRLGRLVETQGNETYLRRLEDAWHELWLKHRGSEELPDDDPESVLNYDLVKHVQFLRSNVDKHSLRIGISHVSDNTENVTLPATVTELEAQFEVVEKERLTTEWEWMWSTVNEDSREKKLKRLAFSRFQPTVPDSFSLEREELGVAESAVKMVMGAPPERYDSEKGASLLKSLGGEPVSTATKSLLSRGVLAKLVRDPKKSRPGRTLKISEPNQSAIGGSIARDLFQDAAMLLEEMDPSDTDWREWPLAATDGDCAALLELTSRDRVEFDVDTTTAQAARLALDWNSKKADDDQIETAIRVQYHLELESDQQLSPDGSLDLHELETLDGHGLDEDGRQASCRAMTTDGPVHCAICLDFAWRTLEATLQDDVMLSTARKVVEMVLLARENGVKKADLQKHFVAAEQMQCLANVLEIMINASIPQVFWLGYDHLVLVSASYAAKWTVVTEQDPLARVFPRRWLDLKGQRISDFWQAAVRAVVSVVIFRPGISQSEIGWRLRAVYDRQEVNELLRHLCDGGFLSLRLDDTCSSAFMPFDENEESHVYWFVGEKHWYQVG